MDELNFCIISGIPGIGKTTLAEIILIKYLEMDFEIIKVSQNINEAFGVYSLGKKQIFLYDDFLGQTGLDIRLSKNEDNDILDFIKHIRKDSNAKFVLTTREYILNQAKAKHESFARSDFDIRRCTISLSDYSKYDKAKILYNYIYFNKLDREYIDNILANDFMKIIYHNNYNPRIIETFTTVVLPKDPQFFFDEIINNLNNPQKIWQNDFERQISNEARDFLILLVSLPPKADIVLVNKIFNYYHSEKSKFYTKSFSDNDYRNALEELDGNFIASEEMRVSFHNPSVKDFLENYILENDVEFKILCSTAMCFEQCVSLFNLSAQKEHKLIRKYNNEYIKTLFRNFLEIEFNGLTIYIYRLFASVDCSSISDRVIFLLKANKVLNSKAIYEFLRDDVFVKIAQYLKLFSEDLEELGKLINYIIRSNEVELLDERNVTKIRDYAIEAVRDYKVERLEKLNFFSVLEEYSPTLITEEIKEEMAQYFEEFLDADISGIDWRDSSGMPDAAGSVFEPNGTTGSLERMACLDRSRLFQRRTRSSAHRLRKMLRLYWLQAWYNLSDEGMEDAAYDSQSLRKFSRIDLTHESVPDATTKLKFRHQEVRYR